MTTVDSLMAAGLLRASELREGSPAGTALPPVPGSAPAREEHATDELFARSPAASLQFLRPMIAFGVVYSLTVIPLMLFVLARTWHAPVCSPLRSWVFLHLLLQTVQLPFRLLLHRDLRSIANLHDEEAALRLLQLSRSMLWYGNRALGFLNCVWFVIGAIWLWSGQQCAASAPGLHLLSVAVFTVNPIRYVVTFLWFCYTFSCEAVGGISSPARRGAPESLVRSMRTFAYQRAHKAAAAAAALADSERACKGGAQAQAESYARALCSGGGRDGGRRGLAPASLDGPLAFAEAGGEGGGAALAVPALPVSAGQVSPLSPSCAHGQRSDSGSTCSGGWSSGGATLGLACHTTSCVICLADFELGEQLMALPCEHIFHCACISKWLQRAKTCPLCQRTLDQPPPTRSSDGGSAPLAAMRSPHPPRAPDSGSALSASAEPAQEPQEQNQDGSSSGSLPPLPSAQAAEHTDLGDAVARHARAAATPPASASERSSASEPDETAGLRHRGAR